VSFRPDVDHTCQGRIALYLSRQHAIPRHQPPLLRLLPIPPYLTLQPFQHYPWDQHADISKRSPGRRFLARTQEGLFTLRLLLRFFRLLSLLILATFPPLFSLLCVLAMRPKRQGFSSLPSGDSLLFQKLPPPHLILCSRPCERYFSSESTGPNSNHGLATYFLTVDDHIVLPYELGVVRGPPLAVRSDLQVGHSRRRELGFEIRYSDRNDFAHHEPVYVCVRVLILVMRKLGRPKILNSSK